MKKYFTLISVAMLAAASVFTSCNKDDESSLNPVDTKTLAAASQTSQSSQAKEADATLIVALGKQQSAYFDQTVSVEVNGQAKTVQFSELTPVSDGSKYEKYVTELVTAYNKDNKSGTFNDNVQIYTYNCGKVSQGSKVKALVNFTIKSDHPSTALNTMAQLAFSVTSNGVEQETTLKNYPCCLYLLGTDGEEENTVSDNELQSLIYSITKSKCAYASIKY